MVMQLSGEDDRRLTNIENKLDTLLGKVSDLVTKQSLTDQRVTNLENRPAQSRSAWTFGLNGCNTLIMAASAFVACIGAMTGVAALVVALLKP